MVDKRLVTVMTSNAYLMLGINIFCKQLPQAGHLNLHVSSMHDHYLVAQAQDGGGYPCSCLKKAGTLM